MNICGVICEYNPFHTGHSYMIRELREHFGMDHIVCFMSGNYVQRGEPAVIDKYLRAESALLAGADLVLEMPVEFSTSSAGDFASCGVSMIMKTGICSHISFGLEKNVSAADLDSLRKQKADDAVIRERLIRGCTYPEAVYGKDHIPGPNTILGFEYLNALERLDPCHTVSVITLERSGDGYLDETVSGTGFASASALRKMLSENRSGDAAPYISYPLSREIFCFPDMLSSLLNDRILREDNYEVYQDVSREIADRIRSRRYCSCSFTEHVDRLKTRQYTRSRISRALLHIILGITKERVKDLRDDGFCPYFRVLAYRQESGLLKQISEGNVPLYTKNARFYKDFPDVLYYDQIWHNTTGTGTELTRTPVIL